MCGWVQCYYERVRQICANDEMLTGYNQLFSSGYTSVNDTVNEFKDAFGESFDYLDPTAVNLMRAVEVSSFSGPDLSSRRDICSSLAFSSAMTFDMVYSRLSNPPPTQLLSHSQRFVCACADHSKLCVCYP